MLKPVRTTAGWLGGRLVLLLIIIAALVASDAYRDEFSLLTAQLKGLLPDRELVGRLEAGREQLEKDSAEQADRVIRELRSAPARSAASIDTRIAEIGRADHPEDAAAPLERTAGRFPLERRRVPERHP